MPKSSAAPAVTTLAPSAETAADDGAVAGVTRHLDPAAGVGVAAQVFVDPRRPVDVVQHGRVGDDETLLACSERQLDDHALAGPERRAGLADSA